MDPEAADAIYADLLAAHDGLSEADSHALNARLVLALAARLDLPAVRAAIVSATAPGRPADRQDRR